MEVWNEDDDQGRSPTRRRNTAKALGLAVALFIAMAAATVLVRFW